MNHDTIKEFEDLSKEYFNVPGHKKLRQGQKNRLPKYSFVVEKFNKEDNIVDAGCGGSYFKGIFPNLIAFDIVDYNNQDYVCNILDAPIPEDSQDGVFCFGVLHECPDEYHLPNIEKMLTYKKIVKNDLSGNNITNNESFNELYKNNTDINEVIGNSCNKKNWNVIEYNNYNLKKKYKTEYDNIKLDINYDLLEKYDTKYLKDK